MATEGICPKCNEIKILTKHHIRPKRHFGKGRRNPECIDICRECHSELEKRIPFRRMPERFYFHIVRAFGISFPA